MDGSIFGALFFWWVIYGVLVIYVSIGGLRDIRKMFGSLSANSKESIDESDDSD